MPFRFYCTFSIAPASVNTLRPSQNGSRFSDDIFKRILLNENVRISIEISLKFVPKGPINNIQALVHIMAWRRSGDKPLSEPMMVSLLTHICVTRPQWVKQPGVVHHIIFGNCWLFSDYKEKQIHTHKYVILMILFDAHCSMVLDTENNLCMCSSFLYLLW